MAVLLIVVAGAVGVLARYGVGLLSPSIWATMGINIAGSFLLGFLVHAGRDLSPEVRNALGVGLLGGFTTYSTFTVQTVLEADGGRPDIAAIYVVLSVVLGIAAAAAGYVSGRLAT